MDELRQLGVNPYPASTHRTHSLEYITTNFAEMQGQTATVVGRIKCIRKFGKIAFVVLRDSSGSLQGFWRVSDTKPTIL